MGLEKKLKLVVWLCAIWLLKDPQMSYENLIQSKGGILSQENQDKCH